MDGSHQSVYEVHDSSDHEGHERCHEVLIGHEYSHGDERDSPRVGDTVGGHEQDLLSAAQPLRQVPREHVRNRGLEERTKEVVPRHEQSDRFGVFHDERLSWFKGFHEKER